MIIYSCPYYAPWLITTCTLLGYLVTVSNLNESILQGWWSEWLSFNSNWAIVSYIRVRTSYIQWDDSDDVLFVLDWAIVSYIRVRTSYIWWDDSDDVHFVLDWAIVTYIRVRTSYIRWDDSDNVLFVLDIDEKKNDLSFFWYQIYIEKHLIHNVVALGIVRCTDL